MRAVIQLVTKASVEVEDQIIGSINYGLVILLGVSDTDTENDATYLCKKIAGLRIFPDQDKLMNKSITDVQGEALVISQFTLYGDCKKGRRPSFSKAAKPELALTLYNLFIENMKDEGIRVASGTFQAMMNVSLVNNGPVTIIIDSPAQNSAKI